MHRYSVAVSSVFALAVASAVIMLLVVAEISRAESPSRNSISRGSISEGPDPAPASEAPPAHSVVVDNSQKERFESPGWRTAFSMQDRRGENYRVARPARKKDREARFRTKIPATGKYTVYARWPADKDNNPAARFGVKTTSGVEWTEVDQRRDGGYWVQIGRYELRAGKSPRGYVRVSSESRKPGRVVADAVAIVRGERANPPGTSGGRSYSQAGEGDGGQTLQASAERPRGTDVVREARRHKGTRYGHSSCRIGVREDCSCHTGLVFEKFGKNLPDSPQKQYSNYGRRVAKSDLRRGDLVFFKEFGRDDPITHVAIYSGNGYIVHASNYYGKVVESEMKWIKGYYGAKRLALR